MERWGWRVGLPVSFRSEKKFPVSLRRKRRVDVGSWREVLAAVPGAVAWILKVRWEGLSVT